MKQTTASSAALIGAAILGAACGAPVSEGELGVDRSAQPLTVSEVKLLASDGATGDAFGSSVSLTRFQGGLWGLVGAHRDDDHGSSSGAVYFLERYWGNSDEVIGPASSWTQSKLTPPADISAGDYFGRSVSIDWTRAAIGAYGDDDNGTASGSVHVYRWQSPDFYFRHCAKLLAPDGAANDYFGNEVVMANALADRIVVASAYGDDDKGYNSGSVYIFENQTPNEDDYAFTKKLAAPDGHDRQEFGRSLAVMRWYTSNTPSTLVAGAAGDRTNGDHAGAAYIFERHLGGDSNWGFAKKLLPSDVDRSDFFGKAVAIYSDWIVVGAPGAGGRGAAYVFERNAGGPENWGQVAKLVPDGLDAGDWFGDAVAIHGIDANRLLISARDDDAGDRAGAVYLYRRDIAGHWNLETKVVPSSAGAVDYFGFDVSLSSDVALVGAYNDDDLGRDAGATYGFNFYDY